MVVIVDAVHGLMTVFILLGLLGVVILVWLLLHLLEGVVGKTVLWWRSRQ